MNMKKLYIAPSVETTLLLTADIITFSSEGNRTLGDSANDWIGKSISDLDFN